eukprot:TRINITY_DN889_c0_g2_i2.p1 TRINITY_DN889_c0_g2~~TRINITY_DN889_c0_g2_i2.p1  ORF type:complete len:316 (-),score=57.76 TRINITY_DN889_c0_g2_i2:190-1137(-)
MKDLTVVFWQRYAQITQRHRPWTAETMLDFIYQILPQTTVTNFLLKGSSASNGSHSLGKQPWSWRSFNSFLEWFENSLLFTQPDNKLIRELHLFRKQLTSDKDVPKLLHSFYKLHQLVVRNSWAPSKLVKQWNETLFFLSNGKIKEHLKAFGINEKNKQIKKKLQRKKSNKAIVQAEQSPLFVEVAIEDLEFSVEHITCEEELFIILDEEPEAPTINSFPAHNPEALEVQTQQEQSSEEQFFAVNLEDELQDFLEANVFSQEALQEVQSPNEPYVMHAAFDEETLSYYDDRDQLLFERFANQVLLFSNDPVPFNV